MKIVFVGGNSIGYQVSVVHVLYCIYRESYTSRVGTKLFSCLNPEIRILAKVLDCCSVVQSPEALRLFLNLLWNALIIMSTLNIRYWPYFALSI
jgi:hypothetical protein